MTSPQEIISAGFIEVRVKTGGMAQRFKLVVKREHTAFGEIPFLVSNVSFPNSEMLRIANELQLPIKSGSAVAFPTGKMAKDFSGF